MHLFTQCLLNTYCTPSVMLDLGCKRERDRYSHVLILRTTGTGIFFTFLWHLPLFSIQSMWSAPKCWQINSSPPVMGAD